MLKFIVTGQSLMRIDSFCPVEKSVNYLKAEFIFSDDWAELDKKAVCRCIATGEEYDAHILCGACLIPWEVIAEDGCFEISVMGFDADTTVTTSVVSVDIGRTLVGGSESNPPSETEMDWIRQKVLEMKALTEEMQSTLQPRDLAVTLSDDMTSASHSPSEIASAAAAGITVVMDIFGEFRLPFVALVDGLAVFCDTLSFGGSTQSVSVAVADDLSVSLYEAQLVTSEDLAASLPKTLPNPYSLNINGNVYDGSKSVTVDIPAGKDGITPHIGENGNWWSGDTDTGVSAGGTSSGGAYPALVDDITVDTEGQSEIALQLDLTACYEARIYISVPSNGLGSNYSYYLATGDGTYQNNLSTLSSLSAVSTGSYIRYKALAPGLGEFSYATGMQGADIDSTDVIGGTAQMIVPKSPRSVYQGTKLVSGSPKTFTFPVGTRIMSYAWSI